MIPINSRCKWGLSGGLERLGQPLVAAKELCWREDEEDGSRGHDAPDHGRLSHNVAAGVMISRQVSQCPNSRAFVVAKRDDVAVVVEGSLSALADVSSQAVESLFRRERWPGTKCRGSLILRREMTGHKMSRLIYFAETSNVAPNGAAFYFVGTDDMAHHPPTTLFRSFWWRGTPSRGYFIPLFLMTCPPPPSLFLFFSFSFLLYFRCSCLYLVSFLLYFWCSKRDGSLIPNSTWRLLVLNGLRATAVELGATTDVD